MSRTTTLPSEPSEVAILSRLLLNGQDGFTPELARHFLSLGFREEDRARMHELAEKNQAGRISPQELRELDSYVKAGDLLAILQSKARKFLKARPK
jgi:hypothetical protein